MRESSKKNMPDIMEAIFDAGYLIFDLIAGILFFVFSKGNPLFILYGVLTLTLCGGDAFHLVPRIIRAVHGSSEKIRRQLGIGLQVSSITMTVFYIILLYVWNHNGLFSKKIPVYITIRLFFFRSWKGHPDGGFPFQHACSQPGQKNRQ